PDASAGEVRSIAWDCCGIVRCGDRLRGAITQLESSGCRATEVTPDRAELRNIRDVALLIARAALAREESRGAHFRTDFPVKRAEFEGHSVLRNHAEIRFE